MFNITKEIRPIHLKWNFIYWISFQGHSVDGSWKVRHVIHDGIHANMIKYFKVIWKEAEE